MNDSDIAIQVQGVSKSFRIPHENRNSFREHFVHLFSGLSYENFTPLNNVSFSIKKGEFVGIIGKNGSGKSTLLKLLAGIYKPDTGSINVQGALSAFLELGIGFHPELSARENVFFNGMLLGMTRKQVEQKFDEIITYAGVERFVDQKLKNYSSGMQVRLAFAVAIQSDFDILLLDEVLAVGDIEFQEKSEAYFHALKSTKETTVILVTHVLETIDMFCDTVYALKDGKILQGAKSEILKAYQK